MAGCELVVENACRAAASCVLTRALVVVVVVVVVVVQGVAPRADGTDYMFKNYC